MFRLCAVRKSGRSKQISTSAPPTVSKDKTPCVNHRSDCAGVGVFFFEEFCSLETPSAFSVPLLVGVRAGAAYVDVGEAELGPGAEGPSSEEEREAESTAVTQPIICRSHTNVTVLHPVGATRQREHHVRRGHVETTLTPHRAARLSTRRVRPVPRHAQSYHRFLGCTVTHRLAPRCALASSQHASHTVLLTARGRHDNTFGSSLSSDELCCQPLHLLSDRTFPTRTGLAWA